MTDYRFYNIYIKYLQLESISLKSKPNLKQVVDMNDDGVIDLTDLSSSEDTKKELSDLNIELLSAIKSLDDMSIKTFMDNLHKIAMNVFELLKKKRKNMKEEFIFKDLFNKIYDISKINKYENIEEIKNNISLLMKDINYHLNKFHKNYFTGNYSYN
jgi:hypothetical protein